MEVWAVTRDTGIGPIGVEKLFTTRDAAQEFCERQSVTPHDFAFEMLEVENDRGHVIIEGLDKTMVTSFPFMGVEGNTVTFGSAPDAALADQYLELASRFASGEEQATFLVQYPDGEGGLRSPVLSVFTLDKFIWEGMGSPTRIVCAIGVEQKKGD